MCGIAGIVFKCRPAPDSLEKFEKAVSLMSHRGPDNFGKYHHRDVHLYHYRLSIIDLAQHANQPFTTPGSDKQLSFNGEIYNYRDLAKQYNVSQTTHSDTEVLFRLLDFHGAAILPELNGIFALSLLDANSNSVTLVRDRLGVKPLYFIDANDYFAFASEAKVIMDFLPEFHLDFQVLHEFLWFGSSISNKTLVHGIRKLPPGTSISIDLSTFKLTENCYWSVDRNIVQRNLIQDSYDASKRHTRVLLEKSIERQCISDVPIGAYLSGGIDSSTVVALASRFTENRLNTYSVSFDSNSNSELPLARLIADMYRTNHHEFEVKTSSLEDDLEALVFQYDEPFADPAALPLHLMAQQNREITRVVLQGDGGDELFGGYGRHLDLSELPIRKWGAFILSMLAVSAARRKSMRQKSWALNAPNGWMRMARLVTNYLSNDPKEIIGNDWHADFDFTNPFQSYKYVYQTLSHLDPLQTMLYTDMQVILPHTYLEKVDKVNMLHSIEARVPLLDNDLVDYVMRLPSSYKLRNRITKSFFREAVADLLPREILYGRKTSFGTPMGEWLRSSLYPFVKDLFMKSQTDLGNLIKFDLLLRKLELHRTGQEENSSLLWRSAVLIMWLNKYRSKINIDREG